MMAGGKRWGWGPPLPPGHFRGDVPPHPFPTALLSEGGDPPLLRAFLFFSKGEGGWGGSPPPLPSLSPPRGVGPPDRELSS